MTLIDFNTLISELSEESFERVKFRIKPYFYFYFVDGDNADRNLILEKIGEFLRNLELKTGKRDNDLANMYMAYLYKFLDNRIRESTRADAYFKKSSAIMNSLKDLSAKELVQSLEDFTKIFVCLYSEYLAKPEVPVEEINFYLKDIDLDAILKKLDTDTPQMVPMRKIAPSVVRNIVPQGIFKGVDDAREAMAKVTIPAILPAKKKTLDDVTEPIHDAIELDEMNETYNAKSFASILLTIMFHRIFDFECGLV